MLSVLPKRGLMPSRRAQTHACAFRVLTGLCAVPGAQPNGVALSPVSRTLYVTDTGCLHPAAPDGGACTSADVPHAIYAFDVKLQRCACTRHHLWSRVFKLP